MPAGCGNARIGKRFGFHDPATLNPHLRSTLFSSFKNKLLRHRKSQIKPIYHNSDFEGEHLCASGCRLRPIGRRILGLITSGCLSGQTIRCMLYTRLANPILVLARAMPIGRMNRPKGLFYRARRHARPPNRPPICGHSPGQCGAALACPFGFLR